jgi:predicted dehydrogenase
VSDDGLLIVGCGAAAEAHAAAYRRLRPAAPLYCLAGPSGADRFAARHRAILCADVATAHARGARAAVVATPPMFHHDLTCGLLAAGLDVLVEKPMAMSTVEARRMQLAARTHQRTLAVGHVMRCVPALIRLRALVAGGGLGRVNRWHEQRFADRPTRERAWWPALSTGLLGFQAIHSLDLVEWLLGGPLDAIDVECTHRSAATGWLDDYRIDAATATTTVAIEHSFARHPQRFTIELTGTRGRALVSELGTLEVGGRRLAVTGAPLDCAFEHQLERFLARAPVCDATAGVRAMLLLERCLRVARVTARQEVPHA